MQTGPARLCDVIFLDTHREIAFETRPAPPTFVVPHMQLCKTAAVNLRPEYESCPRRKDKLDCGSSRGSSSSRDGSVAATVNAIDNIHPYKNGVPSDELLGNNTDMGTIYLCLRVGGVQSNE
ncbi:hypothetical protein SCLCIDRAFT_24001 [Scleroderma citrinum Foug A]|uniref:Uncharacterized protein n=1 Tax=Scleroderma citrinum Foug A TaxID=1036808 RepID=A0A0C3E748_9AGAM|nr:hypothetical protein SCLCIDRAFT_24001 [Scleroderma citrinum Foug A]